MPQSLQFITFAPCTLAWQAEWQELHRCPCHDCAPSQMHSTPQSPALLRRTRPRGALRLACLAGALLASTGSHAALDGDIATLPLETLMQMEVRTASRYAQTLLEAPAAMSVVTAEDIRTFGYRTLADILNGMRGLYTSYDRSYHYLGLRGFATPGDYNTRVLLLVDGVRYNDNVYDQAAIGTDFILDTDLIERVEFLPGPGSAIYGANAFFGVINVITKDGAQLAGARASVELGSQGHARLQGSWGTVDTRGASWLLSVARSSERGKDLYFPLYDTPDDNHGVAHGLDYDRSTTVFARMRHEGLSLSLAHSERTKGIPTAAFSQRFNDPRSFTLDENTRLAGEYTTRLTPGIDLTTRLHAGRYRYAGDYVYDYPPVTVNHDTAQGQWWGAELQWVSTTLAQHKLVWGLDYRRDTHIAQFNADLDPTATYLDTRRKGQVLAAYLQDEWALRSDLALHTGLRYDRHAGLGGGIHPRLGLVYWASPSTTVKLLHGTAYRPPNAYERDYRVDQPGGVVDSGAPLRPERVRTTELAMEHAPTTATRMLLTVFRSEVHNLIALGEIPALERLTFSNVADARVQGMEAEIEHRWGHGLRLKAAYGWQQARNAMTGEPLVNAPRHLAKLQWSGPIGNFQGAPWTNGRLGLEITGMDSRLSPSGRVAGHMLAHLTYTARLAGGTELSAGIRNLFNRHHADPASFEIRGNALQQDGRSLRVKLTHVF